MREPYHLLSHGWIVAARPKPTAEKRLYCFSHAGAGSAAFRGWAEAAVEGLEVCTVNLPGRENRLREPAFTSVHDIVKPLTDAIVAIQRQDERPFAFYGHSMGATVSFETTRELRRRGVRLPDALFVAASRAPQLAWPYPPVTHLDDIALLKEVHRRYGSVPAIIMEDADLRTLLTPTLRADMNVVETYRLSPERSFDFPIVAFAGDRDSMAASVEMQGWGEQTSAAFQLRVLPGEHIFIQTQRDVLLADIASTLGVAAEASASPDENAETEHFTLDAS